MVVEEPMDTREPEVDMEMRPKPKCVDYLDHKDQKQEPETCQFG